MTANLRLPLGWLRAPLSQLIEPRGEKVLPATLPSATFLGMDHVESQTTRIIGGHPAAQMKSAAARFYSGDVLYGRLRPYLNKVARPQFDGLASAEFMVFPDTEQLKSAFLKHRLNAADFVSFASHLNEGDRPRVSFDQIGTFQILLPPPAEQLRIVGRIEELFSELDNGIDNLYAAREQLRVYRQAVLRSAFRGELTTQWRSKKEHELEAAVKLLERVRLDRKALHQLAMHDWEQAISQWEENTQNRKPNKPRAPKNLAGLTDEELKKLDCLPQGWQWAKVGQLASVGTGVTPLKSNSSFYDGGRVPWVTSGALNAPFVHEPSGYVTERALAETNLRLFPPHTLLVALYGEGKTRGKCSELLIEATTNQAIAAIEIQGLASALREFLKWYFTYNYEAFRLRAAGGVQPNLNLGIIENTPVPICSIEEAHEIANILASRLSLADKLGSEIALQIEKAEALRQSILKLAFSGRLVAQDPSDKPASVLLEQIEAEREANNKKPTRKDAA